MKDTYDNSSMDRRLESLKDFILDRGDLFVITGAGVSTGSGIGDYRDRDGRWKRPRPVSHQDFIRSHYWRQRYWGRSQLGYPSFLKAVPNRAHMALVRLESQKRLCGLVTQNVDRLHQKAGQKDVVDLHGRLDQVICMDCGVIVPRLDVQAWLEEKNPHLRNQSFQPAPDGDADMEMDFSSVEVPHCSTCGGILKPHVVFYGDSVDRRIVNVTDDEEKGLIPVKHMLALYIGGMGAKDRNFHKELIGRFGFEAEAAVIQDLYLAGKKDDAAMAVPDKLADEISLVGSIDKIRDRLQAWDETPVTSLNVSARSPAELETLAELMLNR